jgi:O-antigen ligase
MAKLKFFNSIGYLIILSLATLAIWYYGLEHIGIPVFTLISALLLIFNKNGMPVVPFFLNMLFMISQTEWSLKLIPDYLYIVPVVLIVCFIIHIIRFKPKFFSGMLKWPLLLLLAAMFLSMINAELIDFNYLFYCLIGLFYLLTYFFFRSSLQGDNLKFLIKLFAITGIMISVQVLIFYLRVEDLDLALASKNLDLGWGISNFVATYLIVFISALFYFIKKYKLHIFWVLVAAFEIIMLFLTLSRGGVLAFFFTFIFLIIYLFHGYEHKVRMAINIIVALGLIGLIVYLRFEYFMIVWDRLFADFFADNGRFDLWIEAFEKFKAYPLLGAGLFARVTDDYFGFYHNTIIHTAATLGILGVVSLGWQFIQILRIFLKKLNVEKAILLIALIGANIHGMVDNVYYMPQFMIIFFIIIASVENHNEDLLEEKLV